MPVMYMEDSITTQDMGVTSTKPGHTVDVEYFGGYVNGFWANASEVVAHFPGKRHVSIDVNGSHPSADVLDVENGDASPATAAVWIQDRIKAGLNKEYPGVIYCNRDNITAVFNAMDAKGLKVGHDFRTWIATLDGTTHVDDMTGVTAVQVWPATANSGPAHNDLSIVYDVSWKAPSTPVQPPKPPVVTPPVAPKVIKSVVIEFTDGTSQTVA